MPVYYFVIEEDDVWRIRVRGRTYGGYLTRDQALQRAIAAARKSSDEAYVVAQQPAAGYRIAWSNRAPATPPPEEGTASPAVSAVSAFRTQMQRIGPSSRLSERMAACRRLPYRRRMPATGDLHLQTAVDPVSPGSEELP